MSENAPAQANEVPATANEPEKGELGAQSTEEAVSGSPAAEQSAVPSDTNEAQATAPADNQNAASNAPRIEAAANATQPQQSKELQGDGAVGQSPSTDAQGAVQDATGTHQQPTGTPPQPATQPMQHNQQSQAQLLKRQASSSQQAGGAGPRQARSRSLAPSRTQEPASSTLRRNQTDIHSKNIVPRKVSLQSPNTATNSTAQAASSSAPLGGSLEKVQQPQGQPVGGTNQQEPEAQLALEKKARQELEDMLLRLEYHYQAEMAKREAAEAAAAEAQLAAESVKSELAMTKTAQSSRAAAITTEQQQLAAERQSLERMRNELESELHQARAEVAKAQEALASAEEKVRQEERQERVRLEMAHRGQVERMEGTIMELQGQLQRRTGQLTSEMLRWKQQAELAANAVIDAKNEVLARKRELDSTKVKMDELIDKLYTGRELGIELGGQIAGAMSIYQNMNASPQFPPPGAIGAQHGATISRLGGQRDPTRRLPPAQAQLHGNFLPPGMPPFPPMPGTGIGLPNFVLPQIPSMPKLGEASTKVSPELTATATTRGKKFVNASPQKSPQNVQNRGTARPQNTIRIPEAARIDAYQHIQSRHLAKAGTYVTTHGVHAKQLRQSSTQRKSKSVRDLNEQEQRMIAHTARWM